MSKVLVGIQARSTSERFKGKSLAKLYNKPMLSWVVNACADSAKFINQKVPNIEVTVAILCPIGDEISRVYSQMPVVEGDEFDVLSRYSTAARLYNADYICRITGDCPLMTSFLVTNHIFKAINHNIDYLSNVDPAVRTELDGRDIEIFSRKALTWLERHATTPSEKEHVTVKIRDERPSCLSRGHFLNRLDLSDLKLSVDTFDEFKDVENRLANFSKKKAMAERDVGPNNVFFV